MSPVFFQYHFLAANPLGTKAVRDHLPAFVEETRRLTVFAQELASEETHYSRGFAKLRGCPVIAIVCHGEQPIEILNLQTNERLTTDQNRGRGEVAKVLLQNLLGWIQENPEEALQLFEQNLTWENLQKTVRQHWAIPTT